MFSPSKDATALALDISEWVLLLFGAVLGVGIIGEYAKSKWWRNRIRCWQICVIVGVLGELLSDGGIFLFSRRLQTLEGAEIGGLDAKTKTALNDANAAVIQSGAAKTTAGLAEQSSGRAVEKSDTAERSASTAMTLAKGARQEADSFARDIVSAKKQAAEAASHLAEALKQAEDAKKRITELADLSSLRLINDAQKAELVKKLGAFSEAAEIVVRGGAYDTMLVTNVVEGALVAAKWKVLTVNPPVSAGAAFIGIRVTTVEGASASTARAASTLIEELNRFKVVSFPSGPPFPRGQLAPVMSFSPPRLWRWDNTTLPTIRIEIGDKPPFPITKP